MLCRFCYHCRYRKIYEKRDDSRGAGRNSRREIEAGEGALSREGVVDRGNYREFAVRLLHVRSVQIFGSGNHDAFLRRHVFTVRRRIANSQHLEGYIQYVDGIRAVKGIFGVRGEEFKRIGIFPERVDEISRTVVFLYALSLTPQKPGSNPLRVKFVLVLKNFEKMAVFIRFFQYFYTYFAKNIYGKTGVLIKTLDFAFNVIIMLKKLTALFYFVIIFS